LNPTKQKMEDFLEKERGVNYKGFPRSLEREGTAQHEKISSPTGTPVRFNAWLKIKHSRNVESLEWEMDAKHLHAGTLQREMLTREEGLWA